MIDLLNAQNQLFNAGVSLVGAFLDRFDHPAYVPGKLALSIIWAIVGIFAGVACYTRRTS